MAAPFALKDYQAQSLAVLRDYLQDASEKGSPDAAYYRRTGLKYLLPPQLGNIPYVCLRIPTGGGKTIMAAYAIGIAATAWMKTDQPTVLWFVPSKTILKQTLAALRDRANPIRRALAEKFGDNVRIMDVGEALSAKRADYDGGAVIIVSTIQAFRVDETEGRKVYEGGNGELMDHFIDLPPDLRKGLETEDGEIVRSLANVFRLRRPLVIADEAHNMATELSFDTLGRLAPFAIVEFTATPTDRTEHQPLLGKFASNVLHHVSAAELKAAEMIKLPVMLFGRADPKDTIADAIAKLHALAETARREQVASGAFIRPVMLLQAEAKSKLKDTLHAGNLKKMLVEDFNVPADEIALATGDARELDGVDLFDPDCTIQFIITQQALREGWDCSFAYILCSVAPQKSERSVEQLLGRILRMPYAKRKSEEDLNRAFAYATTTSFRQTAELLKDGLVKNGFDRIEAERLVAPVDFGFDDGGTAYVHEVPIPIDIDAAAAKERIESITGNRIEVDLETGAIRAHGAVSETDHKNVVLAYPQAATAIDRLVLKSRHVRLAPDSPAHAVAFDVPKLSIMRDNALFEFTKDEFLHEPWALDLCNAADILNDFSDVQGAQGATIDITKAGRIDVFDFTANVPSLLAEPDMTKVRLINWLDRRMTNRSDILPVSSKLFIGNAIEAISQSTGASIAELGRTKFRILDALIKTVHRQRKIRERREWQRALFGSEKLNFAVSASVSFHFNGREDYHYPYKWPYTGPVFEKHLYPVVGELDRSGEEYECARHIDSLPVVKAWFRNLDQKERHAFWLQTSSDKFYPDFVALLNDGRILVVEYKGENYATNDDSMEKNLLGRLWADASTDPKCLFLMCKDRQFGAIDRIIREGP